MSSRHLSRVLSPIFPTTPSDLAVRGGPPDDGVDGPPVAPLLPPTEVLIAPGRDGVAVVGVLEADLDAFDLSTAVFHFLTRSFAALATLTDSCWRSFPTARPTLLSWRMDDGQKGDEVTDVKHSP